MTGLATDAGEEEVADEPARRGFVGEGDRSEPAEVAYSETGRGRPTEVVFETGASGVPGLVPPALGGNEDKDLVGWCPGTRGDGAARCRDNKEGSSVSDRERFQNGFTLTSASSTRSAHIEATLRTLPGFAALVDLCACASRSNEASCSSAAR